MRMATECAASASSAEGFDIAFVMSDEISSAFAPKTFTETLNDLKTNDKGQVDFDLNLDRFE